ncbi:G-protein coupled receptor Mth2-like [Ischnura elegans]|uniref:G-protein coupled receptor Mth2-like n=1 Tax=Ischnura elegans TaxID=197161 RepID=UPI001ED89B41|nr:G-protein coupled receptor Mth2-like [Ischnura elegans]
MMILPHSLLVLVLLHNSLSLISSTFHYDRERYKQRLFNEKRTWKPNDDMEDREALGNNIAFNASRLPEGEAPVSEGAEGVTVTDLKKLKQEKPVLRKCCNFGEKLTRQGCIKRDSGVPPFHPVVYHNVTHTIDVPVQDLFTLVFGDVCLHGRYRLDPSVEPEDEFYLLDNGSLLQPAIYTIFDGEQDFCMEGFFEDEESPSEDSTIVSPLVCFPPPSEEESDDDIAWILYPAGLLISVPFLIIILVAHILIPKLHGTLNGKCLISHVSFLVIAYIGLATIQLSRSLIPDALCKTIAFIVQFSFIACFSWLTAMCISIWRIISNTSSSFFAAENSEESFQKSHFLKYFIFALAVPVIIILVSLVMDLTPSIPSTFLKPQFGVGSCWFLTDAAALPYFYGPITLLIIGNIILFALTAWKIIQRSREEVSQARAMEMNGIQVIRYENKALKVCFSLFILMGVNWTMEIISWAAGNRGGMVLKSVWYFTDMCNSLQGLFIFIIFIIDSEFRLLIKEKFVSWGFGKSNTRGIDHVDYIRKKQDFTVTSLLMSEPNSVR